MMNTLRLEKEKRIAKNNEEESAGKKPPKLTVNEQTSKMCMEEEINEVNFKCKSNLKTR